MRPRLTYANVMATVAVFIALGGASYAAFKLPKNSVGTKQIKKEAVTPSKIKRGTLTGRQIDASTLGKVPAAQAADTANTANSLAPGEPWRDLALYTPTQWHNSIYSAFQTAAYYKDHEGIVHLRGRLEGGVGNIIAKLPNGFRPAANKEIDFPMICSGGSHCNDSVGYGAISQEGSLDGPSGATVVSLDGIAFRAES